MSARKTKKAAPARRARGCREVPARLLDFKRLPRCLGAYEHPPGTTREAGVARRPGIIHESSLMEMDFE
jgi:hypothetical protein